MINLVNGGKDVVNAMLRRTRTSTASSSSARRGSRKHVYSAAAEHGKRVQALGGAKNFMVVMPDAVMDKTVENIIGSAFGAPASAAWPARSWSRSATRRSRCSTTCCQGRGR